MTHVPFAHWFFALGAIVIFISLAALIQMFYMDNTQARLAKIQDLSINLERARLARLELFNSIEDADLSVLKYMDSGNRKYVISYDAPYRHLQMFTVNVIHSATKNMLDQLRIRLDQRRDAQKEAVSKLDHEFRNGIKPVIGMDRVEWANENIWAIRDLCHQITAALIDRMQRKQYELKEGSVVNYRYAFSAFLAHLIGGFILLVGALIHDKRSRVSANYIRYQSEAIQRVGNIGFYTYSYENPRDFKDSTVMAGELMGIPVVRLVSSQQLVLDFFHRLRPEDQDTLRDAFEACTHNGQPYDIDICMNTEYSGEKWLNMRGSAIYNTRWEFQKVVGTVMDITARKKAEEQISQQLQELQAVNAEMHMRQMALEEANQKLQELSDLDPVTQLRTQDFFQQALGQEFQRARQYNGTFCIAMVDVDGLQGFNEQYGYSAGNEILAAVGHLLRRSVRSTDLVTRYGGDEFVILMPVLDRDDAMEMLDRARERAEEICMFQKRLSLSIGVATRTKETLGAHQLVQESEAALIGAKQRGGNGVVHYISVQRINA